MMVKATEAQGRKSYFWRERLAIGWGLLLFLCLSGNALAFQIVEPTDSAHFKAGQRITVRLELGEVKDIALTRFYWYGEQEDMLEEFQDEKLAFTSSASHSPPFGGVLRIPRSALGNIRLLAVAEMEGGEFDKRKWSIFDEVMLRVESPSPLVEIDFDTDQPLKFGRASVAAVYDQVDFLGKIVALPVVGIFEDGATRSLRFHTTGTSYQSSNETVVTINQDGLMRLVGNGTTLITATNSGKHNSLEVIVEVKDTPNEPPIADPGPNQTVDGGTRVQLNALMSFDPEGESLQYHWSQIRGSKIALLDPFTSKASFLTPFVEDPHLFRFKLRVTDAHGADSFPAFVDVMVEP